ncbi:LXG domain-containing protein [Streptococcus sp. XMC]|uniref:T7SS effector LXG polymorphic toxin n=1 Tax=Streptococcus sp. XMC TaxID=2905972 RepID=UPI001E384920|nr:T7SS effector LXG polymorphic toxin [Streptococcus sp. XMC]MCE3592142.1 LXG domain-containing protein [Streptococcus sp. XMC]
MKIDMTEVQNQKKALSTSQTSLSNQIETAKSSFVNLVNSESLKGDVKSAINAKISNHQIPLMTNFSNAMSVLSAQYDKTIEQFQTTVSETAADAIIDTEYLQGILGSFAGLETNIASVDRETASIYDSISDIISLTNPDASTITTPLSEGKTILTDTKTNMESFNGWKRGDDFSKLLLTQETTLGGLAAAGKSSFTSKEAKAFYYKDDFLNAVNQIQDSVSNSTPVKMLNLVSKTVDGLFFVKKTAGEISENENYNRLSNGMDLLEGYYDLFVKGARDHSSHQSMERSGFDALNKLWQKYSKDGRSLWDVLYHSKLGNKFRSVMTSITESKAWKYVSKVKDTVDMIDGPLKNGIKIVGKGLNIAGWTIMAAEAGYHGVSAYNDKGSRAYKSVGKSVIHAGIETMKDAGPLEATAIGAKFGPVGALGGLAYGTINGLAGTFFPKERDKFFNSVENLAFDAYDGAVKTVKNVGKALTSGWKTVTSWFGG